VTVKSCEVLDLTREGLAVPMQGPYQIFLNPEKFWEGPGGSVRHLYSNFKYPDKNCQVPYQVSYQVPYQNYQVSYQVSFRVS
jgi:hypothetical protein